MGNVHPEMATVGGSVDDATHPTSVAGDGLGQ